MFVIFCKSPFVKEFTVFCYLIADMDRGRINAVCFKLELDELCHECSADTICVFGKCCRLLSGVF